MFLPEKSHRQEGVWWATVHGVTNSWTWLSFWTTKIYLTQEHTFTYPYLGILAWMVFSAGQRERNLEAHCIVCRIVLCTVLCLDTQSCPTLCNPMNCSPPGSSVLGNSPGKHTGVGCHALLQGIFSTQESNPGLPHCRWILDHLSHQGSPEMHFMSLYSVSLCCFHPSF